MNDAVSLQAREQSELNVDGTPLSLFNRNQCCRHWTQPTNTRCFQNKFHLPQNVFCDSYNCPWGWAVVHDAYDIKCKWDTCDKSQCCDKVCSSYSCPKYYELVDDADHVVCKDYKCSRDKCCEKGETYSRFSTPPMGVLAMPDR